MKAKTISTVSMVFIVVLSMMMVVPATAAPTATRNLPDVCVNPGTQFNVVLENINYAGFAQITETLCDGWTYVSSSLNPAQVSVAGNTVTFTLLGSQTVTYTVAAPDLEDACCTITGTIKDTTNPGDPATIGGETEVCTCAGEPPAGPTATRNLPDDCVEPGTEFDVVLENINYAGFAQITETLCDGWTYVSSSLDPAQVAVDGNEITITLLGATPTVTYTVAALDLEDACCTITGTIMDTTNLGDPAPIGGETEVCTCADGAIPGPLAMRYPPATCVDPGTTFDVTVDLADYGPFGQLTETLCEGWLYVSSSLNPAQVAVDGDTVIFTLLGENTVTYTLVAPDLYDECCELTGELLDFEQTLYVVGGEGQVCTCPAILPSATRDLPDDCVEPDTTFDVTVDLADYGVIGQLTETLCEGWTYVSSSLDPAQVAVDGNNVTYTLLGESSVTYTVRAVDSYEECCELEGTLLSQALIMVSVGGESEVCTCAAPVDNPPLPQITEPADGAELCPDEQVPITVVDLSSEGDIVSTVIEYYADADCNGVADDGNSWVVIIGPLNTTGLDPGCYLIRATMADAIGQTGEDQISVALLPCCDADFVLYLEAGWNLVSVPKPILPFGVDAVTLFNLIPGESAYYYDAATASWVNDGAILVVPCQGYWVYKVAAEPICIYYDTQIMIPPVQELVVGWNQIGHITDEVWTVEEFILATGLSTQCCEDKATMIATVEYQGMMPTNVRLVYNYPPAPGLSEFMSMTPGYGYWAFLTEEHLMPGTTV